MSTSPEKSEAPKPEKKKKAAKETAAKEPAVKRLKVSPKLDLVQDVIQLMSEADISELSFEQGNVKIHLRRGAGASFAAPMASVVPTVAVPATVAASVAAAPVAASAPAAPAKDEKNVTLNSPMVGTFYRAPSPEAKVFVEEGDKVVVGQVYCIIEAMKLMNEVKSEVNGKVVKILVQNGQAVEFNQPLITVDPS